MNPTLAKLVSELDALGPNPSMVRIADVLAAAKLTVSDLSEYLSVNRWGYHRTPVVSRHPYELLVMTWLPGQASVPHDHAGAICVMQVVQGEAFEECYRVAPDGYVDLEYSTSIGLHQISAGQDAAVHAIRNASEKETLVTLHVYAPPLREYSRYVPRPEPRRSAPPSIKDRAYSVVVVGGGFSGSSVSAQILRRARLAGSPVRVTMVERQGTVGEGIAYGTREDRHLLNVPAGRMSFWPEAPADFLAWAARRQPNVAPTDYLPRSWYGQYVRETLIATSKDTEDTSALTILLDEVRRVARHPQGGWIIHLARSPSLRADAVVLAIGHRPPFDMISGRWSGPTTRLIANPWRSFALQSVRDDEEVLILGSGLTAVDAVLSLADFNRTATITLVSRRGLAPQAHAVSPSAPVDLKYEVETLRSHPSGLTVREILAWLRSRIDQQVAVGGDWRAIVDGLRPFTPTLWRELSTVERQRFLRHLRPFWEVCRHRMAPAVAERFWSLVKQGIVRLIAGRVDAIEADGSGLRAHVQTKKDLAPIELHPHWVVNCTGPSPSNSVDSNPAIGSLMVDGWLNADELRLGIETTEAGNPIKVDGAAAPDLFVIGTLRKSDLWESTAVPELRQQAVAIADCVVNLISGRLHASVLQDATHSGI